MFERSIKLEQLCLKKNTVFCILLINHEPGAENHIPLSARKIAANSRLCQSLRQRNQCNMPYLEQYQPGNHESERTAETFQEYRG